MNGYRRMACRRPAADTWIPWAGCLAKCRGAVLLSVSGLRVACVHEPHHVWINEDGEMPGRLDRASRVVGRVVEGQAAPVGQGPGRPGSSLYLAKHE